MIPCYTIHATDWKEVSLKKVFISLSLYLKVKILYFLGTGTIRFTSKGCFNKRKGQFADEECNKHSENGITGKLCVCHEEQCNKNEFGQNNVGKTIPGLILILTTIWTYLIMNV